MLNIRKMFNFPHSRISEITGKKYFPTRFELPQWANERIMIDGVDNISLPSLDEINITKVADTPNFTGLLRSKIFSDLKATLSFADVLNYIKGRAPIDGTEIVDWMQETGAVKALLDQRLAEYNRHSQLVADTGDGKYPAVYVEDMRYKTETGYTVYDRGYAIAQTPIGNVNVNNYSHRTIIGRDFIGWGGVRARRHYQWPGILAKWKSLARTPITSTIGFLEWFDQVAPNFFVQNPPNKTETIYCRQVISSSASQTAIIRFRDPMDYTRVLDEAKVQLDAGTFNLEYLIASYPAVPPVVIEIAPQKPSALNSFVVQPR